MSESRKLSPHLEPSLAEARLFRQWRAIADRLEQKQRRRPFVPLLAAATGVLVVAIVGTYAAIHSKPIDHSPLDGAVLESGAAETEVALQDGSQINLEPET